ncbi:hypothetical protein Acr_09g0003300 [Actinidia rufa]|uniref:Retroviral polymerase SH3-like domain-containing protein n=1 Tax=Actinidia rufa TaxID=165716 RepID=A0A7J0F5B1_9ERIC|nr:hypothetical protein Acr_09g0003300 [Actinidia rufa]
MRFSLHVTLLTAFPPLSLLVRSLIVCCSVIALSTIYFPKFLVVLVVHALDPDRDKLDKRAIKYVFLGYSRTQKWYKCYSPFLQCHFVCADVLLRLPVRTLVTISPIEKAIAGLCRWKKLFAPHLLVPPSSAQSGGSSAPLLFPLQSILIPFLLQFVGLNVKNALLHSDFDEVYMEKPTGFVAQGEKGQIFRLLFFRMTEKRTLLIVYVDDIVITEDDTQDIEELKTFLQE